MRDPLNSNLQVLLSDIVEELAPELHDDIPFVFYGHSLGALLAFEVARRFRARRVVAPSGLIVSGRMPPHLPLVRPALHRLADRDLLREVTLLGGIPREIQSQPEMCNLILPPLRTDLKLDETYLYSPEPPLECPVLACVGSNDPEVSVDAMRQWQLCTRSRFVFRTFEGNHFFMHGNATSFTNEVATFLHSVTPVEMP